MESITTTIKIDEDKCIIPFFCQDCGETFLLRCLLDTHIKLSHPASKENTGKNFNNVAKSNTLNAINC